jgi:toxin ParE1/3/4
VTEPRLTEQAEVDLDDLWAFVARDNPDAADRLVDAILERTRDHVPFPEMGRSREELQPGRGL